MITLVTMGVMLRLVKVISLMSGRLRFFETLLCKVLQSQALRGPILAIDDVLHMYEEVIVIKRYVCHLAVIPAATKCCREERVRTSPVPSWRVERGVIDENIDMDVKHTGNYRVVHLQDLYMLNK